MGAMHRQCDTARYGMLAVHTLLLAKTRLACCLSTSGMKAGLQQSTADIGVLQFSVYLIEPLRTRPLKTMICMCSKRFVSQPMDMILDYCFVTAMCRLVLSAG